MNFKNLRDIFLIIFLGWKQIAQPEDSSLRDIAHARCIEGQWPIIINLYILTLWLLHSKKENLSRLQVEMLYEAAIIEGASPSEARSLVMASQDNPKPNNFLLQSEPFIKLPAKKSARQRLKQSLQ